jgi:hypothetical protein
MSTDIISTGAVAYGAGTINVPYPSSPVAGRALLLMVATKPGATATINRPSGWTRRLASDAKGTFGTNGSDAGPTRIAVFERIADGTETGNVTVSITGGNSSWARIIELESSTGSFDIDMAVGEDTSSGTGFSAACHIPFGWVKAGDMLIGVAAKPTDSGSWSNQNFSAAGITVGARTEMGEYATNTGNDIGGVSWYAQVTAGESTADTITATATTSNSTYGPAAIIRVRDTEPPPVRVVDTITGGSATPTTLDLPLPADAQFFLAFVAGVDPPPGWSIVVDVEEEWQMILQAEVGADSQWVVEGEASVVIVGYDAIPGSIEWELSVPPEEADDSPDMTATDDVLVVRALFETSSDPGVVSYPEAANQGRAQQVTLITSEGWSITIAVAHEARGPGATDNADWDWSGSSTIDEYMLTLLLYPPIVPESLPLMLGASQVDDIYVGSDSVDAIYFGSTLLWQR